MVTHGKRWSTRHTISARPSVFSIGLLPAPLNDFAATALGVILMAAKRPEDLLLCHALTTDVRKNRSSARYARIRMTVRSPQTPRTNVARPPDAPSAPRDATARQRCIVRLHPRELPRGHRGPLRRRRCSMGLISSFTSRCAGGVEPTPRLADGQPSGPVPMGPANTAVMGVFSRLSVPERKILPIPSACKSPLIVSGTRPFMAAIAATRRSCCFSQPLCQ